MSRLYWKDKFTWLEDDELKEGDFFSTIDRTSPSRSLMLLSTSDEEFDVMTVLTNLFSESRYCT